VQRRFVVLGLATAAVSFVPEPVAERHRPALRVQRLAVPPEIRAGFFSAAIAVFAAFAVTGLFVSLVPSFLGRELHQHNHAVAGLVVSGFFACATAAQLILYRLPSRPVILFGFAWLLAGLALLMLGLSVQEFTVFVAGTVCGGVGVGLVIMGAIATVNQLAPPEHRGETLSAFFVAAYLGLSIPAIGVGVASQHVGFFSSTLVCSITVAVLLAGAAVQLVTTRPRPAPA